jgi:hypothetical protein
MVLFGGFVNGERVNTVFLYNFNTNEWKRLKIEGDIQPCPRAGHSALITMEDEDLMYIFGGKGEDNDKQNDLWKLNIKTGVWD